MHSFYTTWFENPVARINDLNRVGARVLGVLVVHLCFGELAMEFGSSLAFWLSLAALVAFALEAVVKLKSAEAVGDTSAQDAGWISLLPFWSGIAALAVVIAEFDLHVILLVHRH